MSAPITFEECIRRAAACQVEGRASEHGIRVVVLPAPPSLDKITLDVGEDDDDRGFLTFLP